MSAFGDTVYFQEFVNTDWFNAANWQPAGQPNSSTTVNLEQGYDAVIASGTALAGTLGVGSFPFGAGGPGSLTVDAGVLQVAGQLQLNGVAEVFTTQNGAAVSSNDFVQFNGTGVVTGTASSWSTGAASIYGGSFTAQNGATVTMGSTGVYDNSGYPASLAVKSGAHVTTADLSIYSGGSITVDGAGSKFTQSGQLAIYQGSLSVSGGASLVTGGPYYIYGGGSVLVDGAGSSFTSTTAFSVGYSDSGTLCVQNGATANLSSLVLHSYGATDAVAVVDGTGSILSLGSTGQVSKIGSDGLGTLSVTNGGTVNDSAATHLGDVSYGTGTLIVNGSNSVYNAARLDVAYRGKGNLVISGGGVVNSGVSTLANSGNADTTGTIVGSASITGVGSQWNVDSLVTSIYIDSTYSNTATLTIADGGRLKIGATGSGTMTINGSATINIGTGGLAGTLAAGMIDASNVNGGQVNLVFDHTDDVTVSTNIFGPINLTKNGNGTLTLTGSNSFQEYPYNATTTLNAGTLAVSQRSDVGPNVNFNGGTLRYNTGTFDLTFDTVTLLAGGGTVDTNGFNVIYNNSFGNNSAGAFTKAGAGTLTFLTDNTFSGAMVLKGGAVAFSGINGLGTGTSVVFDGGALTYAGGNTADISARTVTINAGGGTIDTGTNNVTFANSIGNGGAGGLTKIGTGTLTVSASNSYSGTTTITAGTFQIGNGGAAGSVSGDIVDNSVLAFNRTGAFTHAGIISGAGRITQAGTGTLTLSGSNSYAGGTTISGGAIRAAGSASVLGSGTVTLSGGSLQLAGNSGLNFGNNVTMSSNATITSDILSGSAGVTHTLGTLSIGGQTLTIAKGASVTSGTAGLTFGNVTLSANGAIFAPAAGTLLTVANIGGVNRSFTVNGAGDMTATGVLSQGTGTLTKSGAGLLTLTGTASTYTGKTIISGGTLAVASLAGTGTASSLGAPITALNGTIDIGSGATGATLKYIGAGSSSSRIINQAGTTGGATIDASGSGALILSGSVTAANGVKILTLTGTNTGTNTLSGVVANGNTGTVSLAKTGTGSWIVSGANTFTGTTFISDGILTANKIVVSAGNSSLGAASSAVVLGTGTTTGTLAYSGNNATYTRGFTVSAGGGGFNVNIAGQTVTVSTGGVANAGLFSIGGSGNTTIASSISGTGSVAKNGSGLLTLSGSNSYSGGTTITSGTLVSGNNNAMGTGAIVVGGGVFLIQAGVTSTNSVTITSGTFSRSISATASLVNAVNATSNTGGVNTSAAILAGTSSSPALLLTSFTATSAAINDQYRRSDVYSFQGTNTDIFTLQLSFTSTAPDSYLGWLSGGQWVNAVDGNTGNNATLAQQGYAGSFAAFQSAYSTNLALYLGAWGVDSSGGITKVWAVLNHNSDFAVIPEPGTCLLVGLGLGSLFLFRRRR